MIFSVIFPVFFLLFLGFTSVKIALISKEQITALGAFVIKIALPALLLHALSSKDLHEIWYPSYFFTYIGITALLFSLSFFIGQKFFKNSFTHASVYSLGASMSNTGLLGAAILTLLMGNEAMVYISLIVIIESVFLVPLMLTLAEIGRQRQANLFSILKTTFITLFKNPLFLSVLIGMSCAIFKIQIPHLVDQVFAMIGQTASPLALFIIGGGMVGLSIQSFNLQTVYLVVSKNICMPILVYLGLTYLTDLEQKMIYAGTLIAALPMPSIFGIFGQVYGVNEKALTPLMLSTFFGFVVVSVLIGLWW
ncbi:AEC family transporter [Acinetobacter wuhouensis]|uniref:AEC family transporter n=1 Tax=Acinetobacter wuhouensis TaxID=1879050 RepID=A0A4Q7ACG2_9GAMM|nr:AEC family transporter [Acinetobacter wuhouensis]RZG43725.1 AEC family transporter [Acinetobacter wuhouensis]